ncbi:MAG: hypothetical protein HY700_02170 [Gemmatimonadetes bacterium]|nr:hypothetical protein [Gemmatimonadota bacterium]
MALSRVQKKKIAMLAIEGSSITDTDEAIKLAAIQVPAREESPLEEVLSREPDGQGVRGS